MGFSTVDLPLAVHRTNKSLANVEPVPSDDTTVEDGGVDDDASEDGSSVSGSEENDVDDTTTGLEEEHGKATGATIAVQQSVVSSVDTVHIASEVPQEALHQGSSEEHTSNNVTTTTGGTVQDDVAEPTAEKPPANVSEVEETAHRPLHNPPPPPERPADDVCSILPDTLRELRAMETLVKEKKKAIRTLKKQQTDTNDKKAEKRRLEEQLKAIKTEVKAEKAKAKQDVVVRPKLKRHRGEDDDDDIDGDDDDAWLFSRPEKRVLNAIDKWQKGHRR
jgi:hypothetical protein